jgi:uncharacterized metal-binding protein
MGEKMAEIKACGCGSEDESCYEYETVKIRKTTNVCPMCEDYARGQASKPIAIMSCEGGCLRGEVSRQAANIICHKLTPEKTVRVCLGGAFTKDTGQRNLVRNAKRIIAIEGCFIKCSSRMMQGVISDLNPEIILADQLYDFDGSLFGIDEMPEDEIKANARKVAEKIVEML